MPKKHSDITSSDEIHVPKGFTEADNATALVKDESGLLEYRDLSTLGATGPAGAAGTTLVSTSVVDIHDPSAELSALSGNAGDTMQIRQERAAADDHVSTYIFDVSGEATENVPFTVDGSGGQWILLAGTPFNHLAEGAASTGIVDGGVLSINGDNTKFDVTAGEGWVMDNFTNPSHPIATYVKWDALSAQSVTYMAVADFTFVSIDSSGTLIQRFTPFSQANKRQEIYLGVIVHSTNVTITSTSYNPVPAYGTGLVANDIAQTVGPSMNISGNVISAGGASLRISKSAGTSFGIGTNYNNDRTAPNITTDAVQALVSFNKLYRDGSGGYVVEPSTTDIDPNFYDDGSGTLVAVPAGKFQIMQIYFSGSETSVNVNQGQAVYDSISEATANIYSEDPDINPIMENIVLRGMLIVKQGTTNLQTATDAKFIEMGRLGLTASDKVNLATTSMQAAYENSGVTSAQVVTNSANDGVAIKEGSGVGGVVLEALRSDNSILARFTADGDGEINSTGSFFINGIDTKEIASNSSTGIISGCELSVNADPTKFDMTAGTGIVVDNTTDPENPVFTSVVIPSQTAVTPTNLLTSTSTFISIDINGDIVQRVAVSTPAQRRDTMQVGVISHPNLTDIDTVLETPAIAYSPTHQAHDLMQALGFFSTSGNQINGIPASLTTSKTSGSGFSLGENFHNDPKDPHNISMPSLSPATYFQILQDASIVTIGSVLDPTNYDNAGVLTAVPANNNATISYVYIFPNNQVAYLFGQEVFSTFAEAIDAAGNESLVVPPDLNTGALLLARVVLRKNCIDITDPSSARIIASTAVSSGGASVSNMQQTYDISVDPEIIVADKIGGALTIKDSSANATRDNILEVTNTSDVEVVGITRSGIKVSGQAYSAMNTLTDAATIATDCNDGNVHEVTLTDNRTLGAPTNLQDGATYIWVITQDVGGTNTLAYNAVFKFPGGTAPTLTTTGSAVDILTGVSDGTNIYCSLAADFK